MRRSKLGGIRNWGRNGVVKTNRLVTVNYTRMELGNNNRSGTHHLLTSFRLGHFQGMHWCNGFVESAWFNCWAIMDNNITRYRVWSSIHYLYHKTWYNITMMINWNLQDYGNLILFTQQYPGLVLVPWIRLLQWVPSYCRNCPILISTLDDSVKNNLTLLMHKEITQ